MTREEMLKRLGLTKAENDDLMNKLGKFLVTLNPQQKKVFMNLMPKSQDVVKSFGPGVTVEDLETLATPTALAAGVAFFAFQPPPPPPPIESGPPRKPAPPTRKPPRK